ncbi:MAG: hypothetical protein Q8M76_00380, partial [Spirochaetaceae bacterium]|nr:hypothetical protein [Spirochaetaceae bacterium]
YDSSIAIRLECPGSARIYWSIVGADSGVPGFKAYDRADPPRLDLREGGSATYTLAAFAEDDAGNRGPPARFVYRLAPAGLPIIPPSLPVPTVLRPDPSVPAPVYRGSTGKVELEFEAPTGMRVIASIGPAAQPQTIDDFVALSEDAGVARILIPIPYGWRGDVAVYIGIVDGSGARYNPDPFVVHAENLPEPVREPGVPSSPELVVDAAGRGASLFFPVYDGELFVSIDGSDPTPYLSPISLPPGAGEALVGWYGVDADGRRSADGSGVFAAPRPSSDATVEGARDGAIYGGNVALKALGALNLRYELRLDGTVPPEPGASSAAFPGELIVACPEGEESAVVLRYRAFEAGYPGESKSLRFVVDRKAPSPPGVAVVPPPYTDEPRYIVLLRNTGDTVFASVSVDGEASAFALADAALSLPGRDSGPVSYLVRAYSV